MTYIFFQILAALSATAVIAFACGWFMHELRMETKNRKRNADDQAESKKDHAERD